MQFRLLHRDARVDALDVTLGKARQRVPLPAGVESITVEAPADSYEIVASPLETSTETHFGITRVTRSVSPESQALVEVEASAGIPWPAPPARPETAPHSPPLGFQPNIVLIVLDDADLFDLGVTGSTTTRTPRLDQLANQGLVFNQFYSNGAKCSPTRSTLLTGHLPGELGWKDVVNVYLRSDGTSRTSRRGLPASFATVAEVLRESGYATGHIGKWHVGETRPEQQPSARGFDTEVHWTANVARTTGTQPGDGFYWSYRLLLGQGREEFTPPRGAPGADEQYLPRRLSDEAIAFIGQHRDGPFYLNLWHVTPHVPLHVPPGFDNTALGYQLITPEGQTSAMMTDVDREIGRVVDAIDSMGLGSRTLVVVVSDNGGLIFGRANQLARAAQLRGEKGSVLEGGIRVPAMLRWTGVVAPGSLDRQVTSTADLFPTFADLAGARLPAGLSGRSLVPELTGGNGASGDLFWIAPRFTSFADFQASGSRLEDMDQLAVRSGPYKLLRGLQDSGLHLYDLSPGPTGEFTEITDRPDLVAELAARFRNWKRTASLISYPAQLSEAGVLSLPFDFRLDFNDADFSFLMEVRADRADQTALLASREGSWRLRWVQGHVELELQDDGAEGRVARVVSGDLSPGETHRIGFTVYGALNGDAIVSLYVDGQLAGRLLPGQYPPGQSLYAVVPTLRPLVLGSDSRGDSGFQGSVGVPILSTLCLNADELHD